MERSCLKEHKRYEELSQRLSRKDILEQVEALKLHYKNEIAMVLDKEKQFPKKNALQSVF